jgi:hypothetical protein
MEEKEPEPEPEPVENSTDIDGIDETSKNILIASGIMINSSEYPDEILILRDSLLNNTIYKSIEPNIVELRKTLSSSSLTSLQKGADKTQKWPLLNLVRQILNVYGYKMYPIRKADGYTLEGIKKYKRYFQIQSKNNINTNETKIIYLQNDNLVLDNNTDFLDDENID